MISGGHKNKKEMPKCNSLDCKTAKLLKRNFSEVLILRKCKICRKDYCSECMGDDGICLGCYTGGV